MILEWNTGKSFSEALILISSSEHVVYVNSFEYQNKTKNNLCTENVLSLEFSCTKLVIPWTICCYIGAGYIVGYLIQE